MARTTSTRAQAQKIRHGGKPLHTRRDLTVAFRRKWYKEVLPKDLGPSDNWDTTDHAADALQEILDEEWLREEEELREFAKDLEEQRERAAANRRRRELEAAEELLRDASRPSRGAFSSENRNSPKENDTTDELSCAREREFSSHVGWPSPAHKPRKPLPTDPVNPYGKPRFKGNVPTQFRSTDPVGGMSYVRSGKVTKVA